MLLLAVSLSRARLCVPLQVVDSVCSANVSPCAANLARIAAVYPSCKPGNCHCVLYCWLTQGTPPVSLLRFVALLPSLCVLQTLPQPLDIVDFVNYNTLDWWIQCRHTVCLPSATPCINVCHALSAAAGGGHAARGGKRSQGTPGRQGHAAGLTEGEGAAGTPAWSSSVPWWQPSAAQAARRDCYGGAGKIKWGQVLGQN